MKTARELVHEATRQADEQGACNLFHCAFKENADCCIPCVLLQARVDAARVEGLREAADRARNYLHHGAVAKLIVDSIEALTAEAEGK